MVENNEKNKINWRCLFLQGMIFLLSGVIAGIAAFLYGKNASQIVVIVLFSLIGAGMIIFLEANGRMNHNLLFDNEEHLGRFTIVYIGSLLLACLFPLLPIEGWPYLPIFILLALLSNQLTGISGGSSLLLLSVLLLDNGSYFDFMLYFICGLIAITLFTEMNEAFNIGIPVTISLMFLFLLLFMNQLLIKGESFQPLLLLIPCINLLVCLLMLFILLKYVSYFIIHKEKERYMELNDPECVLLTQLKELSREEYYHAIHTAYLSDKIAKRLNMDDAAAKAGGYYHRIGLLKGKNTWETIEPIVQEYKFPEKVITILREYTDTNTMLHSKESIVLLFSDTLVSSILYLFSKDASAQLDYEKIIDAVFKKKTEGELLKNSDITLGELAKMKEIFLEEKLYYDFLR